MGNRGIVGNDCRGSAQLPVYRAMTSRRSVPAAWSKRTVLGEIASKKTMSAWAIPATPSCAGSNVRSCALLALSVRTAREAQENDAERAGGKGRA